MAQWEFVDWLLYWVLQSTVFEFDWDDGNLTKSAKKHGVYPDEVEALFRSGAALPLGVQISPKVNEQRLGLVGPTLHDKVLQVVFVFRGHKIRVISARAAHKKERKHYEKIASKIFKRI